jgi:hypothetical protein
VDEATPLKTEVIGSCLSCLFRPYASILAFFKYITKTKGRQMNAFAAIVATLFSG